MCGSPVKAQGGGEIEVEVLSLLHQMRLEKHGGEKENAAGYVGDVT